MKKIALFGGTGFVGHYLVDALLSSGWQPVVMVRPGSERKLNRAPECLSVSGEIREQAAIEEMLTGADAVIYNIGILREFPARGITFEELHHKAVLRVIDACQRAGVRRFLLMSANGVKPDGVAYQRSKYSAEQALKTSRLDWTIFRPSVLFGNPHGRMEFATQLHGDVIRSPLPAPLFFPGLRLRQAGTLKMAPAHVADVTRAFVLALEQAAFIGETITLCGPESLSWKSILQRIAQTVEHRKLMLPAPTGPVSLLAKVLDRYAWFPLTAEQISMLLEGNTCSQNDFERFGIEPEKFDSTTLEYLKQVS